MRITSLLALGFASLLAGCAPRSAIAFQRVVWSGCGRSALGSTLMLNGRVWVTESDEEMREWLSRIDTADIRSMEVLTPAKASALFGIRGAKGGVVAVVKRGSRTERRFRVPPPPLVMYHYCHRPFPPPR